MDTPMYMQSRNSEFPKLIQHNWHQNPPCQTEKPTYSGSLSCQQWLGGRSLINAFDSPILNYLIFFFIDMDHAEKNSWIPSSNVLYTCILSLLKHANKMIFNFSYSEYGSHVLQKDTMKSNLLNAIWSSKHFLPQIKVRYYEEKNEYKIDFKL